MPEVISFKAVLTIVMFQRSVLESMVSLIEEENYGRPFKME